MRESNISNTADSVSSRYPNTEKRVESTTRSGVFLSEGKRRSKEGGAKEEDRVHGNSNGAGLHVITP